MALEEVWGGGALKFSPCQAQAPPMDQDVALQHLPTCCHTTYHGDKVLNL